MASNRNKPKPWLETLAPRDAYVVVLNVGATVDGSAVRFDTPPRAPVPPAFLEIFRTYQSFVFRTLRYLGVADASVEDVAQDVFLVVHRKLSEFRSDSTVRTWLYGICRGEARNWRRKAAQREPAPRIEEASAPIDERIAARELLLTLLDRLEEDMREVVVLRDIEGLSMKEVATATRCPLSTAYHRYHAARAQMTQWLQEVER